MKVQRLRFRYRVTPAACGLKHREIVDALAGALVEGGVQVAHSEGKRPAPQISLAAPLPLGASSDWELADVYLAERVELQDALEAAKPRLPAGLEAVDVAEIGIGGRSLQSQLRWAEYEVEVPAEGLTWEEVESAIDRLLGSESVTMEIHREARVRKYDLRPLVLDLRLEDCADTAVLRIQMKLRAEQNLSGRADETVRGLGLPEPVRVHRTRLYLADTPAVLMAYRRSGEADA